MEVVGEVAGEIEVVEDGEIETEANGVVEVRASFLSGTWIFPEILVLFK